MFTFLKWIFFWWIILPIRLVRWAWSKNRAVTAIVLAVLAIAGGVKIFVDGAKNVALAAAREAEKATYLETRAAMPTYIKVERVIDGDTILADSTGYDHEIRIRLIGVDTPESVNPDETKNSEEGRIASEFTKSLLPEGTKIRVEFDVELQDKYGRYLGYVYFVDGPYEDRMVQEVLLEEGYARTMTIAPNVAHADDFAAIQKKAQEAEKGFWATDVWD